MKKYLILLSLFILTLFGFDLQAQRFAENYWHNGKILLENGDTLRGNLKFDLQNDLIQLDQNGILKTLTSRKVLAFEFFDRAEQRDRYYYTLPYAKASGYQTPAFFELLKQSSPISLLCRETMVTQTSVNNNPYTFNPGIPVTQTYIKKNFFFLYKNGKIKPYSGNKKDLFILLNDREKDIKDFTKENRTRFDNKDDLISVIEYYNSLKAKND